MNDKINVKYKEFQSDVREFQSERVQHIQVLQRYDEVLLLKASKYDLDDALVQMGKLKRFVASEVETMCSIVNQLKIPEKVVIQKVNEGPSASDLRKGLKKYV